MTLSALQKPGSKRLLSLSRPVWSLALVCLSFTGCVSVPPPHFNTGITAQELAAEVSFLAQPALKGRKTSTRGSRLAREYIEKRFKTCGLIPWGNERAFGLPFGYGENIVGVLPGSDTNLAKEMILVSAHYDHLGKTGGKIYPGAADNASGVAALLEIAKQLSLFEPRSKRSIAFVAFDSEEQMLFGSFAFTCRKDVESSHIVSVVNMDMLGRDFMDAVPHTLFIAGSEHYPDICQSLCQAGTAAGIRILPVGTDLVGPRGDHAAFENLPVPCLFFSCGTFKDYHQPTDTPDKLNYHDLECSARAILSGINDLANCTTNNRVEDLTQARALELHTVTAVMNQVVQNSSRARIKKQDAEAFQKLALHASDLLKAGHYDEKARATLISDALGTLAPYLMPLDELRHMSKSDQEEMATSLQFFEQFYLKHRSEMLQGYKKFVAHVLKYRPGPFRGMPEFQYEICSLSDNDILLTNGSNGREVLHVLLMPLVLQSEVRRSKWLLESFDFVMFSSLSGMDCEGTRQQLLDLCLLRLKNDHSSQLHSNALNRVLQVVAAGSGQDYKKLLKTRLQQGGFKNESEWVAACIHSSLPELAQEALVTQTEDKDGVLHKAACEVIADCTARGDTRALAIDFAMRKKDPPALLALCDAVQDASPALKKEYVAALAKDYPFADRPEVKFIRPLVEKAVQDAPNASKTVGDLACAQLKKACKRDFGKDGAQWRTWVQANVKDQSL